MQIFKIIVNGNEVQFGSQLPNKITSLIITLLMPMAIPKEQVLPLRQWLNTIIDKLDCEYIEYNNVLIATTDLVKFNV